ncbi:hypothetical protein GGX14DRAFT_580017 [Mycena pura]|uniref:Transcription termination and cleavage factor C-terminal domain-containing protein n=1 Tax=Mycena pura TaxID=153505 RepID=A0AAD6XY19_9AGAR|nr:hypothetical protein GGX14DRAFT_580017 [Mycena pura]
MSSEEALIQLLLQLKKTTPDAARQILNERPPIAYALISLMVSMDAINIQVFQKILSDFSAASAPPPAPAALISAPAPLSAIPPHLQPTSQPHSRGNTPPTQVPYQNPPQAAYGYPPAHTPTPPTQGYGPNRTPSVGYGGGYNSAPPADYGTPPRPAATIPDVLANIPEDQRQMLMGVLSMTPEQINNLPPADRANILQLVMPGRFLDFFMR